MDRIEEPEPKYKDKEETNNTKTEINYNGEDYIFHVVPDQDGKMKKKWFSLAIIDKSKNEYELNVNARVAMFDKYTKKDEKDLIVKMAVAVALAQLSSKRLGLKENQSQLFVNQLNEILSNTGKEKK